MRIDKFLSNMGVCTRSEVRTLIKFDEVRINDVLCKNHAQKIDETADKVYVGDTLVTYEKFVYIMLNKPESVICATNDGENATVLSLLPEKYSKMGLFPVGRLDKDTVGLLILTNDGTFAHNVLSPKKRVYKKYFAKTAHAMSVGDIEAFKNGVDIIGYVCLPAHLEIVSETEAIVSICEGKFHQVKRMFEAVGNEVVWLKRIEFGGILLDPSLDEGTYRHLTQAELEKLSAGC